MRDVWLLVLAGGGVGGGGGSRGAGHLKVADQTLDWSAAASLLLCICRGFALAAHSVHFSSALEVLALRGNSKVVICVRLKVPLERTHGETRFSFLSFRLPISRLS